MIIWLASYPKSGNTWVRSFISALYYHNDGKNDFSNLKKIKQFPTRSVFEKFTENTQDVIQVYKNWIHAQDFLNLDNQIKFLKTHHINCIIDNYKFTDDKNSIGAIHIVRDPRNVLLSIKNHYSLLDYESAKNFIFKEKHWLGFEKTEKDKFEDNTIPTLISSWNLHYKTWKNKTKNYLLIKYEDLQKDPQKEFLKITDYLEKITNTKFDNRKIQKAIETTSFTYMQKLENEGFFNENAKSRGDEKVKFFNMGPKTNWQQYLSDEIVEKINTKFKDEMIELGYLQTSKN